MVSIWGYLYISLFLYKKSFHSHWLHFLDCLFLTLGLNQFIIQKKKILRFHWFWSFYIFMYKLMTYILYCILLNFINSIHDFLDVYINYINVHQLLILYLSYTTLWINCHEYINKKLINKHWKPNTPFVFELLPFLKHKKISIHTSKSVPIASHTFTANNFLIFFL